MGAKGGGLSGSRKKNGNLFCRYADMEAFEDSKWEARKTDLGTPLPVSLYAISSRTWAKHTHIGAGGLFK